MMTPKVELSKSSINILQVVKYVFKNVKYGADTAAMADSFRRDLKTFLFDSVYLAPGYGLTL